MGEIGFQVLAWVPGAVQYVLDARPQQLKVLDVSAVHTLPSGVKIPVVEYLCGEIPDLEIDYRHYMEASAQQELLADPVKGARKLAAIILAEIDPVRRHIAMVEGPNETGLWNDADHYNVFTAEFGYIMRREGLPTVAYNFPVGNPSGYFTGDARKFPKEFMAGLVAYWEHYCRQVAIDPDAEVKVYYDGIRESTYIGKHEYSAPTMQDGFPFLCGRFQFDWEALPEDCRDKPFVITEAGIDGGVLGGRPREECGWTNFADELGYLSQIKWYAGLVRATNAKPQGAAPKIKAVHLFHGGSADSGWDSFSILGQSLIAAFIRQQKREVKLVAGYSYVFGFLDRYNQNPTEVGEPTSAQIDIPNVASIQFSANGMLMFNPQSSQTLFFRAA